MESRVEAAVRVQPRDPVLVRAVDAGEETTHKQTTVGLQRHRRDGVVRTGAGIESRVQGAGGVKASEAHTGYAVHVRKRAAEQEFSILLPGHHVDTAIRTW